MKNRIEKEFNITLDEVAHKVWIKKAKKNSRVFIKVDNNPISVNTPNYFSFTQEYFLKICFHECIIVINNKDVDMIVDGISIITGKKYNPLLPISVWSWILASFCFLIPLSTRGGGIPTVIGMLRGNNMYKCIKST